MADQPERPHSHLIEFPEALDVFFTRMGEITAALGPGKAEGARAVEARVQEALAARGQGDVPRAIGAIVGAMELLAEVVGDDPRLDGPMLRAMAAQFRSAMLRGSMPEAKASADVMREQSGSTVRPRKDR